MQAQHRVNAMAAKPETATATLKDAAQAAKAKAKAAAKKPSPKTQETDDRQLAKGRALRK